MRNITVAAIQMRCVPDPAENLRTAERLVRQAAGQGAQVVLLPELFEREYFCQYLQACKADGMDVYLLEYTTDHKLIRRIKKYCRKKKYDYYIADSLELGI